MKKRKLPPLSEKQFAQLRADAIDIALTAKRKNITLDRWEEPIEREAARTHFDLGCWLYYYRHQIYKDNQAGFKARVDCLWRIFIAGFDRLQYEFFTVFEFGERQFDTIFEANDSGAVLDAIRHRYVKTKDPQVRAAFQHMGWKIEIEHKQLPLL